MKIKLYSIAFLLTLCFSSFANKGLDLGGDLGWECMGNGKYKFVITTFYACDSASSVLPADSLFITSNSPLDSIACYKTTVADVTPYCGSANGLTCTSSDLTTFHRVRYESAELIMPGTIPAAGWHFTAKAGTRGALTNSTSVKEIWLRASMYAPSATNTPNPCFDSSPNFLKTPYLILSRTTKQSISFSDMTDTDLDSVVADWSTPWDSVNQTISYNSGYSFSEPFPGVTEDIDNVVGNLSSASSFYSFRSYTPGRFATCVKLTSFRNGQKTAEVYRDLAVLVTSNSSIGFCPNPTPEVPYVLSMQSQNSSTLNRAVNVQGDTMFYAMKVFAGNTVSLDFHGFTPMFKSDCTPQQTILSATGLALSGDSLYGDPNNSAIAGNAATLTSLNTNGSFISATNNKANFNWVTEKVHVSTSTFKTYQFNIRLSDFNCNIPGVSEVALRISIDRPIALDKDSTTICLGDSANVDVTGSISNLTWSPMIGVTMSALGKYKLSPGFSTFYTVTDASTGYSETIFVQVDNIVTPQIAVVGSSLELMNANTYDSLVWTLNGAPIYSAPPHNSISPKYSGAYALVGYKGVCVESSNFIDTTFAANFTLNPNLKGVFKDVENGDMSFGMNVLNLGNSDLTVDYITLFVNHENANALDARFRIFDVNTNQVFSTDSVASVQEGLIEMHGSFTLQKNGSYFMTFYLGDDMQASMYKPSNWPVTTTNNLLNVANASKANGHVILPSQPSDSYPYIHFNFNGTIGINENGFKVLEFYPNPTSEFLNMPEVETYEVLDLTGRLVIKSENVAVVNVAQLKAGVYIIRNSKGASNKFVKQ